MSFQVYNMVSLPAPQTTSFSQHSKLPTLEVIQRPPLSGRHGVYEEEVKLPSFRSLLASAGTAAALEYPPRIQPQFATGAPAPEQTFYQPLNTVRVTRPNIHTSITPPLEAQDSPHQQKFMEPFTSFPNTVVSSTPNTAIRKYKCKICERSFTTSGHLARHTRIHTGEKKHECPFEGCSARFSRQDNCMQHYKTHVNTKSKRKRSRLRSK
ncbi:BA75_03563T0 [Komagataella pastoris]|uniref:BA75_03563T0 n=1 Tax=Komagataella pastoris TaxID=4922 RepID=A0A1B2JF92_PICPA|nr:BA75_03563T0 [Komagataella pastoris]